MEQAVPIKLVGNSGQAALLGRPQICALRHGGYALCWSVSHRRSSHVIVRIYNEDFEIICKDDEIFVDTHLAACAITSRVCGGLAVAWSNAEQIRVRFYDQRGTIQSESGVCRHEMQIPELELVSLATGVLALSWQKGLVFLNLGTVPLLSDVTPTAFSAAVSFAENRSLWRLYSKQARDHPDPSYCIYGGSFADDGHRTSLFKYSTPFKIVGNTVAYPTHLVSLHFDGSFTVAWTDLAYHLGNSIQAVRLNEDGSPLSPQGTLVQAKGDEHVARAILLRQGEQLIAAWSEANEGAYRFIAQKLTHQLEPIGGRILVANGQVMDGGSMLETRSGETVAIWTSEEGIMLSRFPH